MVTPPGHSATQYRQPGGIRSVSAVHRISKGSVCASGAKGSTNSPKARDGADSRSATAGSPAAGVAPPRGVRPLLSPTRLPAPRPLHRLSDVFGILGLTGCLVQSALLC